MSDKAILVTPKDGHYEVIVREGGGQTRHEVTLQGRGVGGAEGTALVRAAFAFLLDREPKEAILSRFDLSVIPHYFPEFEREWPNYLR